MWDLQLKNRLSKLQQLLQIMDMCFEIALQKKYLKTFSDLKLRLAEQHNWVLQKSCSISKSPLQKWKCIPNFVPLQLKDLVAISGEPLFGLSVLGYSRNLFPL